MVKDSIFCNLQEKRYANIEYLQYYTSNVGRLDIDRKIKDFKGGSATEQEVKDKINEYMETSP